LRKDDVLLTSNKIMGAVVANPPNNDFGIDLQHISSGVRYSGLEAHPTRVLSFISVPPATYNLLYNPN
jgi:hypothetical protein